MSVPIREEIIVIKQFEKPTQVQFYDADNDVWIGGIGYKDEIICCECGAVVEIADLYDAENLVIEPNPIRLLGERVDISEYMF